MQSSKQPEEKTPALTLRELTILDLESVRAYAFINDRIIAIYLEPESRSQSSPIYLWDLYQNKIIKKFKIKLAQGDRLSDLIVSPDGKTLIGRTASGAAYSWLIDSKNGLAYDRAFIKHGYTWHAPKPRFLSQNE